MLARGQGPLSLIQLGVQFGLLLIGHTGVDHAGDDHIPAARHLTHGGNPVLSINHVEFAVPKADDHRVKLPAVPVADQLVHVFLLHAPLIGQVGGQLTGRHGADSARIAVLDLSGREKRLLLRLGLFTSHFLCFLSFVVINRG